MKLAWRLYSNPVADPTSPLYLDLTGRRLPITQARFSTLALGGYGDGSLTISNPGLSDALMQDALANWLTKRIVASDGSGFVAFEGYISEVHVQRGYHTYVKSVDPLANYVWIEHQQNDSLHPGATRYAREPVQPDSTISTQSKYGIKERWENVESDGLVSQNQAQLLGQQYLALYNEPKMHSYTIGGTLQAPSISLSLLGYWSTLSWRKQTNKFNAFTDVATIIKTVLQQSGGIYAQFLDTTAAGLSGIASTGRTITYNTGSTPTLTQDFVIDTIKYGNANGRQLFFQVWENRKAYLTTRNTSAKIYTRSDDDRVWDNNHQPVPKYKVRAGDIVLAENTSASIDALADIINHPYASLIDTAIYDAIADRLDIPAPNALVDPALLMSRARRRLQGR